MTTTKKTRNPSKGQVKYTATDWKSKAIFRRKENEKLHKRIRELEASRDGWKRKCQELRQASSRPGAVAGEKAAKHQYSLAVVALVLELYKYGGMSLRGCRHSLCCMLMCMGLAGRVPSHASIRNWICKCGKHRVASAAATGGGYVVIVDESMTFGSEKILLILGVREDRAGQAGALGHDDVEVLFVGAAHEWKAEQIAAQLRKSAVGKEIKYAVSDQGPNLLGAFKLLGIKHIEDCTHILANYLKRIYGKSKLFEEFMKLVGTLRREWGQNKEKCRYVPPGMRSKMRFANIFPCVDWAEKMLAGWDLLDPEVQDKVKLLKDNAAFFQSLSQVAVIFKTVCAKLKNEGSGLAQKQELIAELEALGAQGEAAIFLQDCKDYLDGLSAKNEELEQERLLCSSDIIESYFGKFKAKINPNTRSGLTEFIFVLATFGKPFSIQETKQALETIRCQDLRPKDQAKAA